MTTHSNYKQCRCETLRTLPPGSGKARLPRRSTPSGQKDSRTLQRYAAPKQDTNLCKYHIFKRLEAMNSDTRPSTGSLTTSCCASKQHPRCVTAGRPCAARGWRKRLFDRSEGEAGASAHVVAAGPPCELACPALFQLAAAR